MNAAMPITIILLSCLVVPAQAAENRDEMKERICHVSPDKKFAMRILHEEEHEPSEAIPSEEIHDIQLVTLPSKRVVAHLLREDDKGTNFGNVTLLWSSDSKRCAFYYQAPRMGYTMVYRLVAGKFVAANKPGDLKNKADRDAGEHGVKSEFIRPLRWSESGTLTLLQDTIYFYNDAESEWELTAALDGKASKVRVVSARLLSPEEAEKLQEEAEKVTSHE